MRTELLSAILLLAAHTALPAAEYTLPATQSTVVWGYYSADAKPALTVHSGDVVHIRTASSCPAPDRLLSAGVRPSDIPANLREIHEKLTDKGPVR